ncbi:major facilitator superfamily [Klebsormidium nitens]|uniref:Major facilitator superfamily n=1 Tax=Klebsormidium nitens TaxID=105231 RepID=A0A1Y1IVA9_KLENI|nr:major facilitator superfamily [Klebsormidium nitens]|eukprot:GAQ92627.1 major facilitator superfamily [Klebsormidium nitens]
MAVVLARAGCSARALSGGSRQSLQADQKLARGSQILRARTLFDTNRPHGCQPALHPGFLLRAPLVPQRDQNAARWVVARGGRPSGGQAGVADKRSEAGEAAKPGLGPSEQHIGPAEEEPKLRWAAVTQSLDSLPERYKTVLMTSLAFVICNMDKVNMSVAIVPMSHQYSWSATTAGLVQSSFFWGYALSQMPGGWLAARLTGKRVLAGGVFVWSLATALVPLTVGFLPGLYLCRLLVGLGEGVSPPAATDLVAKTVPPGERARAVATVFGGLNVGSVAGLLVAPALIESLGWESVFYLFGAAGIVWCYAFNKQQPVLPADPISASESGKSDNGVRGSLRSLRRRVAALGEATAAEIERERQELEASTSGSDSDSDKDSHAQHGAAGHGGASFTSPDGKAVPWRAFFARPPLWSMMYVHFAGNWGHFTLLAWLPTYFSEVLHLDLTHAALVSILPPLASVVMSSVAAPWADGLIAAGTPVTQVRKLCQTIAFLGPATCMLTTSLNPGLPSWAVIAVLTAGLSLGSFALSGLYCTHQDISPKYASVLLGITNTVGAVPGIVGVALTGIIFDQTDSWKLALFFPSIFFQLTGALVWNIWFSAETQDFDAIAEQAK